MKMGRYYRLSCHNLLFSLSIILFIPALYSVAGPSTPSLIVAEDTLFSPIPIAQSFNPYHSYAHQYIYNAHELAFLFKEQLGQQAISFLLGVSTSEHQCSKKCTPDLCDWSRFAHKNNLKQPTDKNYTCNWWDNYETYIDQLKSKIGINSLRLSIEWCLVQPRDPDLCEDPLDSFDQEAIAHYAHVIAYLINQDITPIICFHHYTLPCWFADKGGFSIMENGNYFANYCAYLYHHIMRYVIDNKIISNKLQELEKQQRSILWATFNSPEGVAFKGYRQHEAPPSNPEQDGLYWVTEVLKNMMEAHVRAYQAINYIHSNTLENNFLSKPKIGFLKNITQFDHAPDLSFFTQRMTTLACAIARDLNDNCIYNFFTTGTFYTPTPFTTKTHYNQQAPKSLDWIGLNYYSHQQMRLFGRIAPDKNDPNTTDNINYRIYPHGLFRALNSINTCIAAPLSIPIYVTENGCATQDDEKRNRFYKEYLHELLRALAHGIPVHGYLTWTAFDNYEWPKTDGSDPQQSDNREYGLTSVSLDGLILTPKQGASYFINFTNALLFNQKFPTNLSSRITPKIKKCSKR